MKKKSIFIAATGQHVGKTTTCLGILSGLKKRFDRVGFIKPVGQQHITIDDKIKVDKDVNLFKTHFSLDCEWLDMSPVIVASGFTRQYLDNEINEDGLIQQIKVAYNRINATQSFTLIEGTGHVGVGTIIGLNNARVAAELSAEIILIASGGLGSSIDDLALNITLCKEYGVPIRGVILNKVIPSKREMILNYFPKALARWGIPLIGCIPYDPFLSNPTIKDFEALFHTPLLSGTEHRYRHFETTRFVAGSEESYRREITPKELVITHGNREDLINLYLDSNEKQNLEGGMILTGRVAPSPELIMRIRSSNVPIIYVPCHSYDAMKLISSFVSKIRAHDVTKVEHAIKLVEENIQLDKIIGL